MVTKVADSKGRITLGPEFAGMTFLVDEQEESVVLQRAKVVPAREAWLWENEKALGMVQKGLKQLADGRKSKLPQPDIDADAKLAGTMAD